MRSRPVNSPAAPAAGCSVAAAMPVISQRVSSNSTSTSSQPWMIEGGEPGWTSAKPGMTAAASQDFGLYFMVHDPSG